MTLYLWDASDFDWVRGPMDLAAARADDIVGFTHKATEGTSVRHVHTGEALARARDAGLEFIGAYHVVRSVDVAAQVRYFLAYLDACAPWWRSFPGFFLQVDLELWSYDAVSAGTGMAFARQLVAAQPKRVITYASRGQYGNSLAGIVTPLWNAAYGTNPAVHYPDAYRGDGSANWLPYSGLTPVFWQFGSQLRIGSQPGADCNAFRGSLADLRALITGTAAQPTEDDKMLTLVPGPNGTTYLCDGMHVRQVDANQIADLKYIASLGAIQLWRGGELWNGGLVPAFGVDMATPPVAPPIDMAAIEAAAQAGAQAGARAGIDGATIHAA